MAQIFKFIILPMSIFVLSSCTSMQGIDKPQSSAKQSGLKAPKTYYYKETVQVEREVLSYGGKYTCRETLLDEAGKKTPANAKKPKSVVQVDEYPRAIRVEHGYFRSLIDRPCYFKEKRISLKPIHYKAKNGTGTPLLLCTHSEQVKSGYDHQNSGCKRVSGALVSLEAWE